MFREGARGSTLRLGLPARDLLHAARAQQPFPIHPQRGVARHDAIEPSAAAAQAVHVGGHQTGSAAEESTEAVNNDLRDHIGR